MHRRSFLAVALCASLMGCALEPSWRISEEHKSFVFAPTVPLDQRIWFEGTLGEVHSVHGPNTRASIRGTGRYSSEVRIDLEDRSAHWWMMVNLSFPFTLDARTLIPGREIDSRSTRLSNRVDVLGCSGEFRGALDWDHTADRTIVRIEQGSNPNTRLVRFYASFGVSSVVEGAFEIAVQ